MLHLFCVRSADFNIPIKCSAHNCDYLVKLFERRYLIIIYFMTISLRKDSSCPALRPISLNLAVAMVVVALVVVVVDIPELCYYVM